jgi:uncharacterized membrane protein
MWIIGLLLGLALGGLAEGTEGAVLGGLLGALAGLGLASLGRRAGADSDLRKEVASLHAKVNWLYEEFQRQERELARLRGDAVDSLTATASPEVAAPPSLEFAAEPAPQPVVAEAEVGMAVGMAVGQEREVEASPPPADVPAAPAWWSRLLAGNPLAKIGVVLLFFGAASALRLAAEYGLLPVPLRLFLAAAAGVGLTVFGFAQAGREGRRNFGLALQGGGFGLLYLVIYFMLARYGMIGQGLAFAAFAALGIACVLLAARQDGPALAVLGLSGAFLAPVMAGGDAETPLPLFAYFTLLNAFILTVDWFRAWRVLNIAGFIGTLAVGMAWALGSYRPEHYAVTQAFLALFLVAYSAMPVATALLRAPGFAGWQDSMLVFGTPLIGAFLQMLLLADDRLALAWSALIASLYYFGLWALMFRRPEPEMRLIERSHLGLAIALLTVAVPLAFDAQVTSAFWAAEGAAVLWFGSRQGRLLAQATGLLMQFAAGIALLAGWSNLDHLRPVFNDAVLGAALVAAAGLVSARLLRALGAATRVPAALPFAWAALWWLGAGLGEIHYFAPASLHAAYGLLFVAATVLVLEGIAGLWAWPQLRRAALLLLLPALWLAAALAVDHRGHPFAGLMALALPAALALHGWLLARHERLGDTFLASLRHLAAWWLLLLAVPWELAWQARHLAPGVSLWPLLAWGAVPAGALLLAGYGRRRNLWPFAAPAGRYLEEGALPPLAGLALWSAWANLEHTGGGSGLPYLPVLNFFDLTQLAAIYAIHRAGAEVRARRPVSLALAGTLGFLWLTALAGRIAHHWGGVPFEAGRLMDSTLCQALVTLFWTSLAIGAMIAATRQVSRRIWYGGFGLLAVVGAKLLLVDAAGAGTLAWTGTLLGVAVLVLAASYFAPLPPKNLPEDPVS